MTDSEIGRFRRIESIFAKALDHAAGPARDAWLRESCARDADLFEDAASFLRDHEALIALHPPAIEPMPRFGAWQAVRLLGRGGMGTVYLADRADGAFRMSAAVKVVPLALASVEIEERFRRERQFLASLDHPKIARLIDGGMSEHGIPYLVMEFVDGMSIDRFCKEGELSNRDCVALTRQLLDALIYIHGRQVVHRDLKPSNALVDQAGQLKLLDFGTARLADAGGGDAITQSGVFAMTPEYASPEQIAGEPATFASDIYSAGLVLQKILPLGERGPDPQLKLILGKALQAKQEDRYRSAAEMDMDLSRYLAAKPVRAAQAAQRRWLIPALMLCVATCAGVAALAVFRLHGPSTSQQQLSIAVLPFSTTDGDSAKQYLVDGITDEFTNELARLKTLRVVSRSSSMVFKKEPRDLRKIGRELNASHLLDATVERSADSIKIVASLERASDGSRLWTDTYQRSIGALGSIESDLAREIGVTLGISVNRAVKHRASPKAQAHDSYLRARFEDSQMTQAANAQAERDYRHAIELDPSYAEAYAGLATTLWDRNITAAQRPALEDRREAHQMNQKALQFDPELTVAHAGLGLYAMQYDWDWSRAERELQKASSTGQNSTTEINYALLCLIQGRRAEADRHLARAQDMDPLGATNMYNSALLLMLESRLPEAREQCRRLSIRSPNSPIPQLFLNLIDGTIGPPAEPIKNLRSLAAKEPQGAVFLAILLARTGAREEALRTLRPIERDYQSGHMVLYWFALAYAAMDDVPNTAKWLERSLDFREGAAIFLPVEPSFAKMQSHPAFRALRKRMGLDW